MFIYFKQPGFQSKISLPPHSHTWGMFNEFNIASLPNVLPPCSLSGNISACKGRKAPPLSTTYTQGNLKQDKIIRNVTFIQIHPSMCMNCVFTWNWVTPFLLNQETKGNLFIIAISWALSCFFTATGKIVPPLTVASLTINIQWTPFTRPIPGKK